ncbi:Esterase TesA precursor [Flavimaricola marinus]|uniref:Esterase TesA n=2 Tax=Flavimaricola marinus TaxID=1819565 RepID=A0A238LGE8_9RHOB|nr:arylesterase [Flavimaricola marinus]SMY08797.1 Esterase TesA precursor [Flavimaricola marinus]
MSNLAAAFVLAAAPADAEAVTIAALGDSLTAGYGLPVDEGFVPQLEAWLEANGADVDLINAGVSGDTTAGGLSRAAWTLTPDVDAMIVTLGGNDLLRAIDPANSRANLRGILEAAQEADVEVLLVGLEATGNYGPDFKQAFDIMYVDLAEEFDVPLYPNFFAGLLDAAGVQSEVARYMQRDGIHPNAEGVAEVVEAIGPSVLALIDSVE